MNKSLLSAFLISSMVAGLVLFDPIQIGLAEDLISLPLYYPAYLANEMPTAIPNSIANGNLQGAPDWKGNTTFGWDISGHSGYWSGTPLCFFQDPSYATCLSQNVTVGENQGVAFDAAINGVRIEVLLGGRFIFYGDFRNVVSTLQIVAPFGNASAGVNRLDIIVLNGPNGYKGNVSLAYGYASFSNITLVQYSSNLVLEPQLPLNYTTYNTVGTPLIIPGIVNGNLQGSPSWLGWYIQGRVGGHEGTVELYQDTTFQSYMQQNITVGQNKGVSFNLTVVGGIRLEVNLNGDAVFYGDFRKDSIGTRLIVPFGNVSTGVRQLSFAVHQGPNNNNHNYAIISNVTLVQYNQDSIPSPTPTSSPSPAPTPTTSPPVTPTPQPTPTPSPSASPTPTFTATTAPTPSLNPTLTPNPTPSPVTTPTPFTTATPSTIPSPTLTPEPTKISTPTPTPAVTPTPTPVTSNLAFSCKSSASYSSFKVEIKGKLAANSDGGVETGISNVGILLSYSVTGGNSWNELAFVNTDLAGDFSVVWIPSVTSNYLVNATWTGNSFYSKVSEIVNFAVTPYEETSVFSVTSNSTLSGFSFNSETRELSFSVTGDSGTSGYVNVYIPKSLLEETSTLKIYVDGNQIACSAQSQTDSWLVSFTYSHSTHNIAINLGLESSANNSDISGNILLYAISVIAIVVIAATIVVLRKKRTKEER